MFCGIANLVTESTTVNTQTGVNAFDLLSELGSVGLLSLIGTRMLFRLKELGESWTEDGVIFSEM